MLRLLFSCGDANCIAIEDCRVCDRLRVGCGHSLCLVRCIVCRRGGVLRIVPQHGRKPSREASASRMVGVSVYPIEPIEIAPQLPLTDIYGRARLAMPSGACYYSHPH